MTFYRKNPNSVKLETMYEAVHPDTARWYVVRIIITSRHQHPDTHDPVTSFDPNDPKVSI